MASNYPPFDTSRSAEERQAARAQTALDKLTAAKTTKSKDELQLEKEGTNILSFIPAFMGMVTTAIDESAKFITAHDPVDVIKTIGNNISKENVDFSKAWTPTHPFKGSTGNELFDSVNDLAKDFVQGFFETSLGINLGEATDGIYDAGTVDGQSRTIDASSAISTVNTLAKFLIAVPFATSAVNVIGKAFLGERWSESGGEYLHKLTEELGLNWMVGGLLETMFEQATGRELEELVNIQKMPNRIDMMTLRTLARQHKISASTFDWELHKLGYPEEQRTNILKLDTQQLPIGDVATAWLQGYKDTDWVKTYLQGQGYSNEDIDVLLYVYINHVASTADTQYRGVARSLYIEHKISKDQYIAIMKVANTPDRTIDTEVASADLQLTYGRQSLNVSEIKRLWDSGTFHDEETYTHLEMLGYTYADAVDVVLSWKANTTTKTKHISASQILRYMISGTITPTSAYDKLVALGYRPEDASFLIAHPTAQGVTHGYELKPPTVVQAYKDGVIDQAEVIDALQRLGVAGDEAALMIQIANYEIARTKKTIVPPKLIGRGDIKEAFDLGRLTEVEAASRLVTIGYTPNDANFIAMNWYLKLHPTSLINTLPNPSTFSPWDPSHFLPPPPNSGPQEYYVFINNVFYGIYPLPVNPVQPPNTRKYQDPSDDQQYYITIGAPIPPGWTVAV